jgi:enamine deaminase RidA (YjgF/YER057c/UK114 family)
MTENVTTSNPATIHRPPGGGYAHVAVTKQGPRIIEIAGQVGYTVAGTISEEFDQQVRQSFANLKAALESVGAAPRDVTKVRYYIKDFDKDKLQHLRLAVQEFYGSEYRAPSTLIPVPTLFDPHVLFEVEASAAL